MKKFENCEYHFFHNSGEMNGRDLLLMTDKDFKLYMEQLKKMDENKKYCISPDFMLREIAGEYAIIPVGDDNLFANSMLAPNETAAFIWKAFERPSTIEDVLMQAYEEYDVSKDRLKKSIEDFAKEMLEYKILEEVE